MPLQAFHRRRQLLEKRNEWHISPHCRVEAYHPLPGRRRKLRQNQSHLRQNRR